MTVVRGTKQHQVKVVQHRPVLRSLLAVLLLVCVSALIWYSHDSGYTKGVERAQQVLEDVDRLEKALATANSYAAELEQKLANINLGAEVDRRANEEIRQEVIALKEQIAELDEENTFYRGLMAPSGNKRGLTIGNVELSETERPRTFGFKVVMQQLATNHQLMQGYLEYKVVGRANGEDVVYDLNQLSDEIDSTRIKLRFKYFQNVEGELELPESFDPIAIELVAQSTGKNRVTVEKRFGWLVEEVL